MDITDKMLDLEFAFTSHDDSCKDLYHLGAQSGEDVYCRRERGHDVHASGFGEDGDHDVVHAAGFGPNRVLW